MPRLEQTVDSAARLRLAIARLQRLLRHNAPAGLSLTEGSCIALIGRDGPMSVGQIAIREHLSAPAVTKVVDRLVNAGLIRRLPDPDDRRVSLVRLTPKGTRLVDDIRLRATNYLVQRLVDLSSDELESLEDALPVLERLAGGPFDSA